MLQLKNGKRLQRGLKGPFKEDKILQNRLFEALSYNHEQLLERPFLIGSAPRAPLTSVK